MLHIGFTVVDERRRETYDRYSVRERSNIEVKMQLEMSFKTVAFNKHFDSLMRSQKSCFLMHPEDTQNPILWQAVLVLTFKHTEDFARWLVLTLSWQKPLYSSEPDCNLFACLNYWGSSWDWKVLSLDRHFGLIQCNLFWGLIITSAAHSSLIFRPDLEFELLCTLTAITLAPLAYPSSRCLLVLGAIAIIARDETISLKQHIWNRNILKKK